MSLREEKRAGEEEKSAPAEPPKPRPTLEELRASLNWPDLGKSERRRPGFRPIGLAAPPIVPKAGE